MIPPVTGTTTVSTGFSSQWNSPIFVRPNKYALSIFVRMLCTECTGSSVVNEKICFISKSFSPPPPADAGRNSYSRKYSRTVSPKSLQFARQMREKVQEVCRLFLVTTVVPRGSFSGISRRFRVSLVLND